MVATANDPYFARDEFIKHRPDVIILDVEMPRMDGLTFLKKLMAAHPTPVVMFSTYTQAGAQATLTALALGAVDFVAKPTLRIGEGLAAISDEITEKVRNAAPGPGGQARPRPRRKPPLYKAKASKRSPPSAGKTTVSEGMVLLLGASTGGTVASGAGFGQPARGQPAHRRGPAHAPQLHPGLRPEAGQPVRHIGERGGGFPAPGPGPGGHRPRRQAPAFGEGARGILRAGQGGAHGESAQAFGGRAISARL